MEEAVIEFLVKEEICALHIYMSRHHAFGETCMGASSVRQWVEHFKDRNTDIAGWSILVACKLSLPKETAGKSNNLPEKINM
jgi:hypothetical protein